MRKHKKQGTANMPAPTDLSVERNKVRFLAKLIRKASQPYNYTKMYKQFQQIFEMSSGIQNDGAAINATSAPDRAAQRPLTPHGVRRIIAQLHLPNEPPGHTRWPTAARRQTRRRTAQHTIVPPKPTHTPGQPTRRAAGPHNPCRAPARHLRN